MSLPNLRDVSLGLRAIAIATWLAIASSPAAAQSPAKIDCDNAASTVEMNFCALQSFEKADAALNVAYKSALGDIPEMATEPPFDAKSWTEALRNSQRAWLAYRDAECKEHVPMHWTGGTGTNADVLGCMETLTEARTKELRDRYDAP